MPEAITFLGGCIVIAALIISSAIKAAVETTKTCNVNWNPTVKLTRGDSDAH